MTRRASLRGRLIIVALLCGGGFFLAGVAISGLLARLRGPGELGESQVTVTTVVELLLVAAALTAVGLVLVVRQLRSLEELGERLAELRTGAATRLVGDAPSEVEPLVADLNALLEHNERLVERAKTSTGNLALGLKTPLGVLSSEAERLAAHGERAAADLLRQQIRAMQRHLDVHLAQARAAASSRGLGVRSPVGPALDRLVRTLRSLYDGQSIRLSGETEVGSVFRGESADLEEMLGNLLDNACKWAVSQVNARCVKIDGEIVITVDDDGPGLDHGKRDAVFARGARLDDSSPGSGLGLAIVRDLAEAYGGAVVLEDSPLGGLRATLRLPAT